MSSPLTEVVVDSPVQPLREVVVHDPSRSKVRPKPGSQVKPGGRRRTRKVRIPIKHTGDLVKLGYSMTKKAHTRHGALKKAVKKFGRATVSRKLNALAIFNKRRHPVTARKARADRKYVMKV